MSSNDFRQSIRNASLRVKGDILAGHVHAENTTAIKAELAALAERRGSAHTTVVREIARTLKRAPAAPAKSAAVNDWTNLPPSQQVPVFAEICSAVLGGLYQGVKQWSQLTTLVGVTVMPPVLVAGPGSLRPQELTMLDYWVTAEIDKSPNWAQRFACKAASAVNESFRNWVIGFNVAGLPLFNHLLGTSLPAVGQGGTPIQVGQIQQSGGALLRSSIEVQLLSVYGSRPEAHVAEGACKYIARVFAEMWSTSVSISTMQGLMAVGGGPGGIGATVVTSPGILKAIGDNLPNPKKMLPGGGIAAADVSTALRRDLMEVVDRAAGAPTAPRPPDVKKK